MRANQTRKEKGGKNNLTDPALAISFWQVVKMCQKPLSNGKFRRDLGIQEYICTPMPALVFEEWLDKFIEVNIDKVKKELSEKGILVEDWGGKYQCAEISAKKGTGVDSLIEKILLESEMMDLKASLTCDARGIVVESKLDKGRGAVATMLVQKGTAKVGDIFISGDTYDLLPEDSAESAGKFENHRSCIYL